MSKYCLTCRDIVAAEELAAQEAKEANAKRGKITLAGELYIKRGSEFKQMLCSENAGEFCCDACPHFDGPANGTITICNGKVLEFDYLDDERV